MKKDFLMIKETIHQQDNNHDIQLFKNIDSGPLVVQWLKNLLCNAGDAGSIPGPGTKIPHAAGQLKPMRNTIALSLQPPRVHGLQ